MAFAEALISIIITGISLVAGAPRTEAPIVQPWTGTAHPYTGTWPQWTGTANPYIGGWPQWTGTANPYAGTWPQWTGTAHPYTGPWGGDNEGGGGGEVTARPATARAPTTTRRNRRGPSQADECYNFECTGNYSECYGTMSRLTAVCPRQDYYCKVTVRVTSSSNVTVKAECVTESCEYSRLSSLVTGDLISSCCRSHLCNDQNLLTMGSGAPPGDRGPLLQVFPALGLLLVSLLSGTAGWLTV